MRREESFSAGLVTALLLAVLCSGCARPLVERAISARGGPIASLSRDAAADVHAGFPGRWRWRFDYAVPDRLRWTIETYGEEQSVSFDGAAVRFFLGSARVASAPPALGDFLSVVRWTSVTTLDGLVGNDEVVVRELASADVPHGAEAAVEVTFRDDGARYLLMFDESDLLIGAEGPIVLPTIADGRMRAAYSGFETIDGYRLPRRGAYTLDGRPFFGEDVLRWVPNDPRLTPESFRGPPARFQR